jgi:hypothetical protein
MPIASEITSALDRLPDLREYDRFQEIVWWWGKTGQVVKMVDDKLP